VSNKIEMRLVRRVVVGAVVLRAAVVCDGMWAAQGKGYVAADASGCMVWAPEQLNKPDYVPRYTGACRDGHAEGKGKVEWLNKYASMRVSTKWDGYFRNGVFVGDAAMTYPIVPQGGDEYLVDVGHVAGGEVTAFAKSRQDGGMQLCASWQVAVVLDKSVNAADDAEVKQAMASAVAKVQAVCHNNGGSVQVGAYAVPVVRDGNGMRPAAVADGRMGWGDNQVGSYSNGVSAAVRGRAQARAASEQMAASRQRFDAFTVKNGVTAWVTTGQLDTNPFKYEGKIVGVVVELDRMASRDTALLGNGLDGYEGGEVQLHGVTPDFPGQEHTVLMAVRVGKREPMVDAPAGSAPAYTGVTRVDSITCAKEGCYDLLGWARGADRISWGEAYVAAR
jgi:hypothetical protein